MRHTPETAKGTQFQWYRWLEIIKWFEWGKIPMKWSDNLRLDFFGASFMHFGCFTAWLLMFLQFCPRNQLYAWNTVIHTMILVFFPLKSKHSQFVIKGIVLGLTLWLYSSSYLICEIHLKKNPSIFGFLFWNTTGGKNTW